MNSLKKITLKALSSIDLNIRKNYKLYRKLQKITSPAALLPYKTLDHRIISGNREVPIRIFYPHGRPSEKVILYFHGGGWVVGDIDFYTPACVSLADATGHTVVSVDYALAPEHPYPQGLFDCYLVAREFFHHPEILNTTSDNITLAGDSAGGNLAAAVSLRAADMNDFFPEKQILIYPATYHDHSPSSPCMSVVEEGEDYILTAEKVEAFMDLYVPIKDARKDPYVAPLLHKSPKKQPMTLIITSEFDPLRDEGEAYGRMLRKYGTSVEIYRMKDAIHGFLTNPMAKEPSKQTHALVSQFLNEK